MKYIPNKIEAKWRKYWAENQTFTTKNNSEKPKYYVLDMFPYPSGAGLHVGHPLGYIASDVVARYKRHQGFNVLHPMGYDSFGLPAEQYAIQTGQHPEKTTQENITRYREQLDKIGFSFDWNRAVRTSSPAYYKYTQWIFIELFNSWYDKKSDKAATISTLISLFEKEGNGNVDAFCDDTVPLFSAAEWNTFTKEEQQKILLHYRLTYLAETEVNWCPGLGTVLANDEIINGVSERGGFPIVRKKMKQWSMRISAYAERLLQGLDTIDWSESIKESQRNWIGKSVGASVRFVILPLAPSEGGGIERKQKSDPKYLTGDILIAKKLLLHAKEMRKAPTLSETVLWDNLRKKKLDVRFRRQHLIGKYIVDFVCLEKRLIVEVDGAYHHTKEQVKLDEARTLELEQKHNFKVIHFSNEEVNEQILSVVDTIQEELNFRESYPLPSPPQRGGGPEEIEVFTTRPDTIFGVTCVILAPEHEWVTQITTLAQKQVVDDYIKKTLKRSERERMADVKTISGVFTGGYVEHPFTKEAIPVWISDYVLAGYGTGAIMAVPCGDERDYAFANFFEGQEGMPKIKNIFSPLTPQGGINASDEIIEGKAFFKKEGFVLKNSDFLNGLGYKEATKKVAEALEKIGAGKSKINYRLRDAVFSRQRYWGEPFPIYYVNGLPQTIDIKYLPIILPEVYNYLPTEDGLPPLGNAKEWFWNPTLGKVVPPPSEGSGEAFPLELNTMPGWAGSSWYWMRYMDAHNETEFASKEALNYWQNVDLYIGGSEHATGHLLYSRFWNKFLKDSGYAPTEEPFKKLINQGMILGMSAFVYRVDFLNEKRLNPLFVSYNITKLPNQELYNLTQSSAISITKIHVDLSVIDDSTNELDIEKFKNHPLYSDYANAEFITEENGKYIVGREVEKMSKSKYNVVNPDAICHEYGADTLRLYEMFLGPLEQAKPWNTAGITGVFSFLKKLWRLYFEAHSNSSEDGEHSGFCVTDNEPSRDSLKTLHKTIKKVTEDIENFSFNTSVAQFMICVNELTSQQCHERAVLEPLAILISPYTPHIAEELWEHLGHTSSIATANFPKFNPQYLTETNKEYPVSFNGKMRFTIELPLDLTKEQIEEIIMKDERTLRQLDGSLPNKVIIIPGKIINLVI